MDLDEAKSISKALKAVAEKNKDRTYYTFEINISEMALDSAKTIDELIKMLDDATKYIPNPSVFSFEE